MLFGAGILNINFNTKIFEMKRHLYILFFLFLSLLVTSCNSSGKQTALSKAQPSIDKLLALYENGNYFKLRNRLQKIQGTKNSEVRFFEAVVDNAFNESAKSNGIVKQVLSSNSSLPDTLTGNLLSLKMSNHLRLYQYQKALNTAKAIIKAPASQTDSAEVANAKNMSKLLKALADAPPQKISIQKTTTLPIKRDKSNLQRIPVNIGKEQYHFVLDTGAGLSTIMRSVAQKAGMTIKKVGLKVKSATGKMVSADIAVADRVSLGHVVYQNVVFLVFPDKALSFPQINYRIPGIIGFPVIEAAGEVRYLQDSLLEIPANPPVRTTHNLALKGLSPRVLTNIKVPLSDERSIEADSVVCTLDTGANHTLLLLPFYRRHRNKIQQSGRQDTVSIGGAGKVVRMPTYILPKVQFRTGGTQVALKNVEVLTKPAFGDTKSIITCNIGQDVLSQFNKIIINFRSMSFLLR